MVNPVRLSKPFNQPCGKLAVTIIREQIEKDGSLSERIRSVVNEAIDKALTDEKRTTLIENMADAFLKAFKLERY